MYNKALSFACILRNITKLKRNQSKRFHFLKISRPSRSVVGTPRPA
jgi:hypothetical protein